MREYISTLWFWTFPSYWKLHKDVAFNEMSAYATSIISAIYAFIV